MDESKPSLPNDTKLSPTKKRGTPLHRRLSFWIIVFLIVVSVGIYRHMSSAPSTKGNGGQRAPVVVAIVKSQDVPIYIDALGTVTPTYSVTVRTQINGTLMRVLYREGQLVKAGDLLAEIDNRPYLAQLMQFEGQLARDQAQLANAKIDLIRYQTLWKQDSVAQQTLATQAALVKQLEGTVKLDQGQIEATKVNLIYCKIISPINGRIGLRLVDPGNYVQTSDTNGIAVVNMLNPITVIFSIPEDNIPEVMQKAYAGQSLSVYAYDRQQNKLLAMGKLLTVDNQIDPTTGTVRLRAQFQNANNVLFPSQFVNIRLLVKTLQHQMTVPTAAIQNSTNGSRFIYVLNKQTMTVKVTPVVTGVTTDDTTIINSGVTPGESVITAGTDRLTDGATVTLPNAKPTTPAQPSKKRRGTA